MAVILKEKYKPKRIWLKERGSEILDELMHRYYQCSEETILRHADLDYCHDLAIEFSDILLQLKNK